MMARMIHPHYHNTSFENLMPHYNSTDAVDHETAYRQVFDKLVKKGNNKKSKERKYISVQGK